jgi:ketosteroid isomerase-like protein
LTVSGEARENKRCVGAEEGRLRRTAAKNGKRLNTPAAMHLTIANGQIVRMHLYEDTLAVHEAFRD